ncbi:MAG: matrixin family metalloprotease [Planctomycetes bacterium]|nr:matrixin family metalloprotease [Planctomycetota bacterium]
MLNARRRFLPIAAGLLLGTAYGGYATCVLRAEGEEIRLSIHAVRVHPTGTLSCAPCGTPTRVEDGNLPLRLLVLGAALPMLLAPWCGRNRPRTATHAGFVIAFWAAGAGTAWGFNYSQSGGVPITWNAADIPIPYRIHQDGTADVADGAGDEFAKIQDAFAAWDAVSGAALDFTYAGTTAVQAGSYDGVNAVSWAESGWAYGSTVAGINFRWYSGSRILESDIVLNGDSQAWDAAKVKGILLHESGHLIGLEHSSLSTSVLWPTYLGLQALSADDEDGARFLYPASADTTAPGAITTLSASAGTWDGEINLSWTSPGDDGAAGTAATYRVRYATSTITTDAAFDAATAVATGVPTPLSAGTAQTMTVSGLVPGTTYHFAIKTRDEVPNESALSNSPSAAATNGAGADASAPSAVVDLAAATGDASGTIVVTWTAPGDDAGTGTASAYDLRYATSPITTDAAFNAALQVTGLSAPRAGGSSESVTISATPGITYYIALKTDDEIPNRSGLSNSASATAFGTTSTTVTVRDGGGGGGCFLSPR